VVNSSARVGDGTVKICAKEILRLDVLNSVGIVDEIPESGSLELLPHMRITT